MSHFRIKYNNLISTLLWAVAALLLYALAWEIAPDTLYTLGTRTNVATTPQSGYGFATSLDDLNNSQLNQRLNDMKATGVTWLRYDLSWAQAQPKSSSPYNWSTPDRITKAARAHGFSVLMIIDFAPAWDVAKGCDASNDICAPANPIPYANFAGAAAQHYKPMGVSDFEIWNEPNIAFRFEPGSNAKQYVRMLKDSYASIKRVSQNDVVITGGTSPSGTDSGDYTPSDFIKALYANGAKGWFDAIAAHPYTYPITPDESQPTDAWGQLQTVHSIMEAHGDGHKQIWITEFGAPTNGPDQQNDHVSEDSQAQMATEAIHDFSGNSWAGPFFWYDYKDAGSSTDTNQNFFGLVRADGSQKPAYQAFVNAITGN